MCSANNNLLPQLIYIRIYIYIYTTPIALTTSARLGRNALQSVKVIVRAHYCNMGCRKPLHCTAVIVFLKQLLHEANSAWNLDCSVVMVHLADQ
jgi:hypothetical protein